MEQSNNYPDLQKLAHDVVVHQEQETKPQQQEEEVLSIEEMGGTLVYNSYAQLSGCKKIDEYWADRNLKKVQTDILFSKNECKEVNKELFGEKARERDFMTENDK